MGAGMGAGLCALRTGRFCAGGAGGRGRDVGRDRTREEGMWVVGGTAEGGWGIGGGSGELQAAGVCPARVKLGFEYGVGDAGTYG